MKNILLIGVGGTGSEAVDIFFQKYNELGDQVGNKITALVFDTDAGDLKKISSAKTVAMSDTASVGTICDRLGAECLSEWFPVNDNSIRAQEMVRGASQWRKKSYLAFLNLMNKPLARSTFISALEQMTVDPGASCEIYVITSVAGGTGSGSFIPIALYAKRYLRKNLGKDPIVNAMIALPDIYAKSQTPENRIKVYANAYAILRELNAINLVARNYNAGVAEHKKAPIKFVIGSRNDPNVGILFDASDKQYWTPEAAPFSQVFLLDKIPALESVPAHNMVLANSLYTILCTEIGAKFDSEFSNHELLRSQSNGNNAIYAGISTAQLRFPKESVLDYLAHKKTLASCDSEWMTLYNAVEHDISEKEREAKDKKRRFIMKDGQYAEIVVDEANKLIEAQNDEFLGIMERGIYTYDKDTGEASMNRRTEDYISEIDMFIGKKVRIPNDIKNTIKAKVEGAIDAVNEDKTTKQPISDCAKQTKSAILKYYKECIDVVKYSAVSTADAIITLDKKKDSFTAKDLSVLERLLKRDGKYIHPVAAYVQLCMLRLEIRNKLAANNVPEWEDLKKRQVGSLPQAFMDVPTSKYESADLMVKNQIKAKEMLKGRTESAYIKLDKTRYHNIENVYVNAEKIKRTNTMADLAYVWQDAVHVLDKVYFDAQTQLRRKVYIAIAQNLDILIAKYRNFFHRFEKEKEDLVELTKTAYRKDCGKIDSVINVFSTQDDKDYIYKTIVEESGSVTDAELAKTDDIVGSSVYKNAYNSAASEVAQDGSYNDKDSGAYRSLFDNMIKAYREFIRKSEAFERMASYNVIEAMVAACGEGADIKAKEEKFKETFSVAQEVAKPSLKIEPIDSTSNIVAPSNITVFMMSEGTGKYIKKHAEELGLTLPADQTSESKVIEACAIGFIHRFSGNSSARVSVVSGMPDQVLYCTGEIMDITPLSIAKFNELGDDNIYFQNYSKAIKFLKKYRTDMWNPHLGNNLHKRGNLPYMNEAKEKECDIAAVKALLYAFQNEIIVYKDSMSKRGSYYFQCNNTKITDPDSKWINDKNIAQLMAWIRNEDDLVEKWSEEFDKSIQAQMTGLPSLASDNPSEVSNLEKALTNTPFMKMLNVKLYCDHEGGYRVVNGNRLTKADKEATAKTSGPSKVRREGPTAIELAYMIKTSEEASRDCDDAERILDVLYTTFKTLCAYRCNPETNPEVFIQVYNQQLGNFYEALATIKVVCDAKAQCKDHFIQIITWLNSYDAFNAISLDFPMDDQGNVRIDCIFDYKKDKSTERILDYIANGKAVAKDAAPTESADDEEEFIEEEEN